MIVVDLDRTLVSVNSFPRWVFHIALQSLLSGRILLFVNIALSAARRRLLRIPSHARFKEALLRLDLPDEWQQGFALTLLRKVRKNLLDEIAEQARQGVSVVLCSAAPQVYLEYFADAAFGGSGVRAEAVGSKLVGGLLRDNSGPAKADALRRLPGGGEVDLLYTDSREDLPIAGTARKIVLVHPSAGDLAAYYRAFPGKVSVYE